MAFNYVKYIIVLCYSFIYRLSFIRWPFLLFDGWPFSIVVNPCHQLNVCIIIHKHYRYLILNRLIM